MIPRYRLAQIVNDCAPDAPGLRARDGAMPPRGKVVDWLEPVTDEQYRGTPVDE